MQQGGPLDEVSKAPEICTLDRSEAVPIVEVLFDSFFIIFCRFQIQNFKLLIGKRWKFVSNLIVFDNNFLKKNNQDANLAASREENPDNGNPQTFEECYLAGVGENP